jgi:L-seryl-tRNA(Ser) seleniumtransferase
VPSAGIAIKPTAPRGQGRALAALATVLRNLPMPVIGHVADGSLVLDLRCLEDEAGFVANLASLAPAEEQDAGA